MTYIIHDKTDKDLSLICHVFSHYFGLWVDDCLCALYMRASVRAGELASCERACLRWMRVSCVIHYAVAVTQIMKATLDVMQSKYFFADSDDLEPCGNGWALTPVCFCHF